MNFGNDLQSKEYVVMAQRKGTAFNTFLIKNFCLIFDDCFAILD